MAVCNRASKPRSQLLPSIRLIFYFSIKKSSFILTVHFWKKFKVVLNLGSKHSLDKQCYSYMCNYCSLCRYFQPIFKNLSNFECKELISARNAIPNSTFSIQWFTLVQCSWTWFFKNQTIIFIYNVFQIFISLRIKFEFSKVIIAKII